MVGSGYMVRRHERIGGIPKPFNCTPAHLLNASGGAALVEFGFEGMLVGFPDQQQDGLNLVDAVL